MCEKWRDVTCVVLIWDINSLKYLKIFYFFLRKTIYLQTTTDLLYRLIVWPSWRRWWRMLVACITFFELGGWTPFGNILNNGFHCLASCNACVPIWASQVCYNLFKVGREKKTNKKTFQPKNTAHTPTDTWLNYWHRNQRPISWLLNY